jgi:hypothetical protein
MSGTRLAHMRAVSPGKERTGKLLQRPCQLVGSIGFAQPASRVAYRRRTLACPIL